MDAFSTFQWILEMLGTIAFAISGSIIGIRSKLDLFGVSMLSVITATCGGLIRDVILGIFPPVSLQNPSYILLSIAVGIITFCVVYFRMEEKISGRKNARIVLLWMDSIGLGVFTVVGIAQAYRLYPQRSNSLFVLAGVLTGVGGGLIRDVIVNDLPQIFRKDIYASASIVGALVCTLLIRMQVSMSVWMLFGTILITIIRLVAVYRKWELPKLK
ncbi:MULTISPECIES: trimeric intracellular cation channel family protein [Terrabacteria group]|uniref:trimeric intracellular cation channel family protein n=1 Tax=Bacillati TaxID=1783272 RepID=UPI001C6EC741|nr:MULTISPECIES: TRIC cation channel family protein [Terrabacteria group]MBW9212676.1 TRIC cation channel family protein [Trueperella sp. zg.1013]